MDYCVQDLPRPKMCGPLLDEWFIPSWMQQCTYQYPLLPLCIKLLLQYIRRLGNVTHQVCFWPTVTAQQMKSDEMIDNPTGSRK